MGLSAIVYFLPIDKVSTAREFLAFQASRPGRRFSLFPGVETPGYSQVSLRDILLQGSPAPPSDYNGNAQSVSAWCKLGGLARDSQSISGIEV